MPLFLFAILPLIFLYFSGIFIYRATKKRTEQTSEETDDKDTDGVLYGARDMDHERLNVFYVFLFSRDQFFYLLSLLNSEIKCQLGDAFNTAAIGNSLTKSDSSQTLTPTLRQ